jgi:hypothetical protein
MRRCLCSTLVLSLLLAGAPAARGQGEAKAILDKALKAHGGLDKINKVKAVQTKAKGTIDVQGNMVNFTQESTVQTPDKLKETVHISIMGQQLDITTIYNGKEGWVNVRGMTINLEGALLDAVKDAIETMTLTRLAFVGGKDYELAPLGETKVNDRPAVGVKVSQKGHKDVNLYFDKETGLLSKIEHRVKDPMGGQEINEERIILEYQDIEGMKAAKKILVHRDGKKYMEAEVTEAKYFDKIDDSEFAKP